MRLARRLLIVAAILGALFFGANVVAERVAERRIAGEAQRSFGSPEPPHVSIEGFPILVDILRGRIARAALDGRDLRVEDLRIARLRITLEDVRASLSDLSAGRPVRVARGLATAEVAGAAVNDYVRSRGHDVTVAVRPGRVVVSGEVRGAGPGTAEGTPTLVGRLLRFEPDSVSVRGRPLRGPALAAARRELSFEVDLPVLPGGVRVTAVEYAQDKVTLIARLRNATIDLSG